MQQAANIIRQAAQGLDYAHQRGLIHRDVKPGNVLVTPEGKAKVSDLGLAGFIHLAEEDPRAGKIVGTADYLSPEQIRSPRGDHAGQRRLLAGLHALLRGDAARCRFPAARRAKRRGGIWKTRRGIRGGSIRRSAKSSSRSSPT